MQAQSPLQFESNLDKFPAEIVNAIVVFLNPETIIKLAGVNQSIRDKIVNNHSLLKFIFRVYFPQLYNRFKDRSDIPWYDALLIATRGNNLLSKDVREFFDLAKEGDLKALQAKKINGFPITFEDFFQYTDARDFSAFDWLHFKKHQHVLNDLQIRVKESFARTIVPAYLCILFNDSVDNIKSIFHPGIDANKGAPKYLKECTPLHFAAMYCPAVIEFLITQKGALINALNNDLDTPLMLAIKKGNEEAVDSLLKFHPDLALRDASENSIYTLAVRYGNLNILKKLLSVESFSLDKIRYLLYTAVEKNSVDFVTYLLEISIPGSDGLKLTVLDLKGCYDTALVEAIAYGNIETVKLLIAYYKKYIAEKNKDDATNPLSKELYPTLQHAYKNTALHYAVKYGHFNIVKFLIDEGADVNCVNYKGNTPLHIAAEKGHAQIADLLIKNVTININKKNNDKKTAFDLAKDVIKDRLAIFNYIEKREQKVDKRLVKLKKKNKLTDKKLTKHQNKLLLAKVMKNTFFANPAGCADEKEIAQLGENIKESKKLTKMYNNLVLTENKLKLKS